MRENVPTTTTDNKENARTPFPRLQIWIIRSRFLSSVARGRSKGVWPKMMDPRACMLRWPDMQCSLCLCDVFLPMCLAHHLLKGQSFEHFAMCSSPSALLRNIDLLLSFLDAFDAAPTSAPCAAASPFSTTLPFSNTTSSGALISANTTLRFPNPSVIPFTYRSPQIPPSSPILSGSTSEHLALCCRFRRRRSAALLLFAFV